jgi:MFS family permease
VLRNRNIWLLAVAFGCFNLMFGALATYLPTFLNIVRGLTLARAALLAGITTFVTIFSCPAGGLVSDRLGSRRRLIALGLILAGVLLALCGAAKGAWYILVALLAGLFMGLVPTNIFASAVEAAGDGRRSGLAMAMIAAGQNAGLLLGPVVFGSLIESTGGWPAAFVSLAIVAMLGAAAGWLARTR